MNATEFERLAREGHNRIPIVLETAADLDTPLSVYLKLAGTPYSYLLESVVGGERFGRYSIIGLPARCTLKFFGNRYRVLLDGKISEEGESEDPLGFVESFGKRFKAAPISFPLRFFGGLVGYFGYDAVRYIEPKLAKTEKKDTLGTPDILLMASEELAVFDNLSGKLYLIVYADPGQANAFERAHERLDELRRKLRAPVRIPEYTPKAELPEAQSEIGEAAYLDAVDKSKRYIVDGDIMQVQISQRITLPFDAHPSISTGRCARSTPPPTCSISISRTSISSAPPPRSWSGRSRTRSP